MTWDLPGTGTDAAVAGPGRLVTTGTTTINGGAFYGSVDAGLTWNNSGTVLDFSGIDRDNQSTTSTLTITVNNLANGIFDFAADGFAVFENLWNSGTTAFNNAGLLEKTAAPERLISMPR